MKNKLKFIGIIAVAVVLGFSLITCSGDFYKEAGGGPGGEGTTYGIAYFFVDPNLDSDGVLATGGDAATAIENFATLFTGVTGLTAPDTTLRFGTSTQFEAIAAIITELDETVPDFVWIMDMDDGVELSAIEEEIALVVAGGGLTTAQGEAILAKLASDGFIFAYLLIENYDSDADDEDFDGVLVFAAMDDSELE